MCLAVPGRILAIRHQEPAAADAFAGPADAAPGSPPAEADPLWRFADVDFGGVCQRVSLACLPQARVGDQVLVHVGIALCVVEEGS